MFRGLCAVSNPVRISAVLGLFGFAPSVAERRGVTNWPRLSHSKHTVASYDHISRSAQCAVKKVIT